MSNRNTGIAISWAGAFLIGVLAYWTNYLDGSGIGWLAAGALVGTLMVFWYVDD
ncbi:MAG: hypothetical protein Q8R25_03095 [bacterium]|nr:hypothetical protein [bacterium]